MSGQQINLRLKPSGTTQLHQAKASDRKRKRKVANAAELAAEAQRRGKTVDQIKKERSDKGLAFIEAIKAAQREAERAGMGRHRYPYGR